jgi:hypothetical protein
LATNIWITRNKLPRTNTPTYFTQLLAKELNVFL